MPNRLADAASPYLRSHADNPVDWWQWGAEAFAEAARRDVPVLVSIGYSTCHWCHVMARESFSDPAVAEIMNANLVCIKVDREEHAEVDSTYLAAASAFTQDLGWPLNVFVAPTGKAFLAGTYWPPQAVGDHPAFRQVLGAVLEAWRDRRAEVERSGEVIAEALSHSTAASQSASGALPTDFAAVVAELEAFEDVRFGGLGGAPKFPVSPVLGFLLDVPADLGTRTLDAIAASPLRDPVDGGFFRYATKRDWSDPHYERMLYDNAQLLALYARSGRADIAEGIAGWLTSMQQPSGGFASAQDSESTVAGKRVEGVYYALDAAGRARVEPPPTDAKILTGWNGLAIEGLALAGTLLERPDWVATAARAADFLLAEHCREGNLARASIGGIFSSAHATLEDYGMLASGLLHLATATGEVRYASAARGLVDASLAAGESSDTSSASASGTPSGTPFGTPGGADPVLAAQGLAIDADPSDGAHPSGHSAMASAAHRLYLMTGRAPYLAAARQGMELVAMRAIERPISFGAALGLMARLAEPVRQLVVVGDDPDLGSLARRESRGLSSVVSVQQAAAFAAAGFELYEGRTREAAYLCRDFVCSLPVTSAQELVEALVDPV